MIYEMRQYLIERGRMDDNHDRMQNHTPRLLEKHGVHVVGRWSAVAGPRMPLFCYVMEWKDFAEREACWGAFYADPEWARIRAATNAGSEMVEENHLIFMRPNPSFEQDDRERDQRIGGLHQLVTQKILPGQNTAVSEFLSSTYLPRIQAAGAKVMAVCDMVSGPAMPALVMLFSWPDETVWRRGWRAFDSDPVMADAYRSQRAALGTTLLGSYDCMLMEPTPYALPFASFRTTPR
jgi:hypothetical protein